MMKKFVTDTMALVLHLEKRKMPEKAKQCFEDTEKNLCEMVVPTMVIVEIGYLHEKQRITLSVDFLEKYFQQYPSFREQPLTLEVVKSALEIADIPELHDRLIAGTAKLLGVELITNDPVIEKSISVKTLWK
jgi:PIN domain nuclease of toxin-antitoxin system